MSSSVEVADERYDMLINKKLWALPGPPNESRAVTLRLMSEQKVTESRTRPGILLPANGKTEEVVSKLFAVGGYKALGVYNHNIPRKFHGDERCAPSVYSRAVELDDVRSIYFVPPGFSFVVYQELSKSKSNPPPRVVSCCGLTWPVYLLPENRVDGGVHTHVFWVEQPIPTDEDVLAPEPSTSMRYWAENALKGIITSWEEECGVNKVSVETAKFTAPIITSLVEALEDASRKDGRPLLSIPDWTVEKLLHRIDRGVSTWLVDPPEDLACVDEELAWARAGKLEKDRRHLKRKLDSVTTASNKAYEHITNHYDCRDLQVDGTEENNSLKSISTDSKNN